MAVRKLLSVEGIGTSKAGYAGPEEGPFKCSHCPFFFKKDYGCSHPDVKEDPDIPKLKDGRGHVHPDGCCNYYRPVEKIADVKLEDVGL